jgi:hypothetical protein
MRFCQVTRHSELLKINAEEKIIDYIVHLRNQKLSSHPIHSRLTAIYHFYTMNDMLLNTVKINKYKGQFRKVKKDRAYSLEEIHKLLDIAGLKMKVCILLMASAGLRVGSILKNGLSYNSLVCWSNIFSFTDSLKHWSVGWRLGKHWSVGWRLGKHWSVGHLGKHWSVGHLGKHWSVGHLGKHWSVGHLGKHWSVGWLG